MSGPRPLHSRQKKTARLCVTDARGFRSEAWPSLQPHEQHMKGDNVLVKDASATVSLQGSSLDSFQRAALVSPWKVISVLQARQGERAQEAEQRRGTERRAGLSTRTSGNQLRRRQDCVPGKKQATMNSSPLPGEVLPLLTMRGHCLPYLAFSK